MTTTGWAKLCLQMAEKDMNNLQNAFGVAESLKDLKSTRKVSGNPDILMTTRTIDEEEHEV
eukprot:10802036-Lingulodinium_polyedra.AAC.1